MRITNPKMKKMKSKQTKRSVRFLKRKTFSEEQIEFNSVVWESWRRSRLLKDIAGNSWRHVSL